MCLSVVLILQSVLYSTVYSVEFEHFPSGTEVQYSYVTHLPVHGEQGSKGQWRRMEMFKT